MKKIHIISLIAIISITTSTELHAQTAIIREIPMDELLGPNDPDRSVLLTTCSFMLRLWTWLKQFVYIMAACGLAVMSFQASLMGKFSMGNFTTWASGLFVMAMTDPVIAFLTSSNYQLGCTGIQQAW